VWAEHEACDDGNDIVHDDCTLDCAAAFCGDGFIHAGAEDCDDVNDLTGDGCAPGCVAESADIYMMISGPYQTGLLYRYAVDDDVWETIETGVWFDGVSGIVYREGIIYWVAGDSRLWSYDLDANTVELTDVTFPGTPTYELVAADGRIYAYNTWWSDGDGTDLHVIENGAITSTLHFASEAGFGATWDPVAHELYVNLGYSNWGDMTDQNLGFLVVDTTTDTVVRTFEVDLDGDGATGAYVGGAFYNRLLDGTLQRFDAFDGTHTDTGVAPASQWFSRAVANQATGKIYLSGIQTFSGHFEVYDTVDGSLTVLASPTVGDDDNYYAPMVLVYPEG
jgi:cysteine-rich repeat protein